MKTSESYYLSRLREELTRRQAVNSGYSLRAFARDLEMDSSNLSAILRSKRQLPSARLETVIEKLGLSPKEKMLFSSSVYRHKAKMTSVAPVAIEKQYLLDEIYFRVISEWEYYAFLNLLTVKEFKSEDEWICQKLDITKSRLKTVIDHLIELGFITLDEHGHYQRLAPKLETSEDVESSALQKSHREALELASKKLAEVEVELRDFSSMTLNLDLAQMPLVKAMIREFQDKLEAFVATGENKENVYQINCQLFPLTKILESEKELNCEA